MIQEVLLFNLNHKQVELMPTVSALVMLLLVIINLTTKMKLIELLQIMAELIHTEINTETHLVRLEFGSNMTMCQAWP